MKKFSKEKVLEVIDILTNWNSEMEIQELQVKFERDLYSGTAKLIDKKIDKIDIITITATITPNE